MITTQPSAKAYRNRVKVYFDHMLNQVYPVNNIWLFLEYAIYNILDNCIVWKHEYLGVTSRQTARNLHRENTWYKHSKNMNNKIRE